MLQLWEVRPPRGEPAKWEITFISHTGNLIALLWLWHSEIFLSQVNTEGELTNLEMFETFPDYNETAKVLGGRTGVIPEKLTT